MDILYIQLQMATSNDQRYDIMNRIISLYGRQPIDDIHRGIFLNAMFKGIDPLMRVHNATGESIEIPNSDNAGQVIQWHGYRIHITYPDIDDDILDIIYPGIDNAMQGEGAQYVYRTGFHGSSDLVHYAFSTYDPGNEYDIYDLLKSKNLYVMIDELQGRLPSTFAEVLALHVHTNGRKLERTSRLIEAYQLDDILPTDLLDEIVQY